MTIKFVCSCGKRMKARDEMAGRRSFCPRCGEPVGIPGGTSTSADGTPGPLSPQDRRRLSLRRQAAAYPELFVGPVPTIPPPPDPLEAVTPVLPPGVELPEEATPAKKRKARPALRSRSAWNLETRWYECLAYPLRAAPLILSLAVFLAIDSMLIATALPHVNSEINNPVSRWLTILAAFITPTTVLMGYVCGFLDCVLASGAAGEAGTVRWPGRDLRLVVQSLGTWAVCLAAGPLEMAVGAYYYWMQSGDADTLDNIILAELGFVTFGYWLFVLASVNQQEKLSDSNPIAVALLIDRMGFRAWAVAIAASLLGVVHFLGITHGLENLREEPVSSFGILIWSWISGLFWATFMMRLLGVWSYRSKRAKKKAAKVALESLND